MKKLIVIRHLFDDHDILDPYSELSFLVITRLIGDGHVWLQMNKWCLLGICKVWVFVDRATVANSVTDSMLEILLHSP